MTSTADLRKTWAGHTAVEQLCDALDETQARNDEARAIIQYEYDRHVEFWGNDGSTLKDDGDYLPALTQVRKMYRWLEHFATPPRDA